MSVRLDMVGILIHRELLVPPEQGGRRADLALAELWPEFSRARIQQWIRIGAVTVDGLILRPRDPLAPGAKAVLNAALEPVGDDQPEAIALGVVHEDAAVIVIDKPAGLVVHPGAGNRSGTLVNALLHRFPELGRLPRAGLVHRLDKDTSGLLVVARTVTAHTRLVEFMQARRISREYRAVVAGVPTAGGTVDQPIGRHPSDRTRMAVQAGGRAAVTHFRVLERFRAHALLGVQLETGRTHQIRVHLAHLRHPIVGDATYGRRVVLPPSPTPALVETLQAFHRQALHACRLAFPHPEGGEPLAFEAPPPADFEALVAALRADVA